MRATDLRGFGPVGTNGPTRTDSELLRELVSEITAGIFAGPVYREAVAAIARANREDRP